MDNSVKISSARRFGQQSEDTLADRYLIYYNESGVGKDYVRTYELHDNDRSTLITARAFGWYFSKHVEITVSQAQNQNTYFLKPRRKLANSKHDLFTEQGSLKIATIERKGILKNEWQLMVNEISLAITATGVKGLDRFIESFDGGVSDDQYAITTGNTIIGSARKTSVLVDPSAEDHAQEVPQGMLGKIVNFVTSRGPETYDAIALGFAVDQAQALEDHMLMALMMVHHEYNIARASNS